MSRQAVLLHPLTGLVFEFSVEFERASKDKTGDEGTLCVPLVVGASPQRDEAEHGDTVGGSISNGEDSRQRKPRW